MVIPKKKFRHHSCWNCGLHHFLNKTNVAQIQGDQVRQHLYFHAKNLIVPAEMYAESHDWNGRGHTDHGLQTSHYHWKTRMHEERRSLGSGDSDADSGRESEFDALADSGENLESGLEETDLARCSADSVDDGSVVDSV
jgi:hypothetical protein